MKEYFETSDFSAMQISSKEDRNSDSPMEEGAAMPFVSSAGSFYMSPTSQPHHLSDYGYYSSHVYHAPGAEVYTSLMYPESSVDPSAPLMFLDHGCITSPSSTSSSNSLQSMGFAGSLCFSKEYPHYPPLYASQEQKFTATEKEDCAHDKQEHTVQVVAKKHKETKHYNKRNVRDKSKKRCSNCYSNNSPSWRRSISPLSQGALLCNACGLYEKTAKKKRMLVINDDGTTKVVRKRDARDYSCTACGVQSVTRWRRLRDSILCEKCARRAQKYKSQ